MIKEMKLVCAYCESDKTVSLGREADRCLNCARRLEGLDDYKLKEQPKEVER